MSTIMVMQTTIMLPILAAASVLIHYRAPLGFVPTHGIREGRAILSAARQINTNRYGTSYD